MNYYYKPIPLPGSRVQQWTKQKIPASGGIDKTSKIYSMSNAMEFKKKKKKQRSKDRKHQLETASYFKYGGQESLPKMTFKPRDEGVRHVYLGEE